MNTTSERLKQETSLFVGILVPMSSWNFVLSWVEHENSFITLGPNPDCSRFDAPMVLMLPHHQEGILYIIWGSGDKFLSS